MISKTEKLNGAMLVSVLAGTIVSLVLGFVTFLLTAGGHGTYLPAALLFPGPLLIGILKKEIGGFSIAVALLQWPSYFLLFNLLRNADHKNAGIIVLSLLHGTLAIACFVSDSGQFL